MSQGEPRTRAIVPSSRVGLPREFDLWRASLGELEGMRLLDAALEVSEVEDWIPALPAEDLYQLIQKIGLPDAEQLLKLASSEQVQLIFDLEFWAEALPSVKRADPWLHALMRAGSELLIKRMMELDRSLLLWIVRRSVEVIVVEDPEDFDPPDQEHVLTPDRRLCLVFPREGNADLPIKLFLNWGFQLHDAAIVNLLLASSAALDSNLEEDAFRWRQARLADRGFIDYYEALAIYTPPPIGERFAAPQRLSEEEAPSQRWLQEVINPDERLDRAFAALSLEESFLCQEQLGFVCNQALSADRVELWDRGGQEATLARVREGLALALDCLEGSPAHPQRDGARLISEPLSLIFRRGYAERISVAAPLRAVSDQLRGEGESSALEDLPQLARWAEALLKRHPESLSGPLDSLLRCAEAREVAELLADLVRVSGADRPAARGIGATLCTRFCRALMEVEAELDGFPLEALEALHTTLFLNGALRPEVAQLAEQWWRAEGGVVEAAPRALLREIEDQLAKVPAALLEPRFVPLLIFSSDCSL